MCVATCGALPIDTPFPAHSQRCALRCTRAALGVVAAWRAVATASPLRVSLVIQDSPDLLRTSSCARSPPSPRRCLSRTMMVRVHCAGYPPCQPVSEEIEACASCRRAQSQRRPSLACCRSTITRMRCTRHATCCAPRNLAAQLRRRVRLTQAQLGTEVFLGRFLAATYVLDLFAGESVQPCSLAFRVRMCLPESCPDTKYLRCTAPFPRQVLAHTRPRHGIRAGPGAGAEAAPRVAVAYRRADGLGRRIWLWISQHGGGGACRRRFARSCLHRHRRRRRPWPCDSSGAVCGRGPRGSGCPRRSARRHRSRRAGRGGAACRPRRQRILHVLRPGIVRLGQGVRVHFYCLGQSPPRPRLQRCVMQLQ